MKKLEGKVAIITGAASGIGEAQAKLFVQEGARVIVADIDAGGAEVAARLGGGAAFVNHDVANEESWSNVMAQAEKIFGLPEILINTAGISTSCSLEETTFEDFERQYRVNQLGVFLGMRAAIAPMRRASGGAIVNISSAAGLRAIAGLSAYSATKWAVRGMSLVAALELAPLNIRVNVIFPGSIATPLAARMMDVYDNEVKSSLPIARMGNPSEIAEATLFLVSDGGSYILGAELAVDGGQTL
jgi:3alpha(or 20beta)-hydroxysteroid dehydrogenase